MRLQCIERFTDEHDNASLVVAFTSGGILGRLTLALPAEWDTWDRAQKVAWGKQQIVDHLAHYTYATPGEVIYPDTDAPEQAADDFEALPGWATWTGQEAADWIDANVVDLASAKTALTRMAQAIVYLRDVVIGK